MAPLVAWGIIRSGTDYSPLPWNIKKSIKLWIFISLSCITEKVRGKKEKGNKNRTISSSSRKDTCQIEWSKQPEKKLSKHIFVLRQMMLARLKSHCSKKEGSLLTWDTMADIKGAQVYVDRRVFWCWTTEMWTFCLIQQ